MGFCNNAIAFVLLWLLTFLINHLSICIASDEVLCIPSERQALLNFKHHLLDPSSRLASWSENTNCCNWTSVVCNNATGHILQLHLRTSPPSYYYYADKTLGFGGEIHPSILDLKHLRYLDLSGNDFGKMQIPSFLGSMKSLTYLNLSYAIFSGNIPHQMGNLSSLISLDLGGNSFAGNIPQQIGNLSNLQFLDLSGGYKYTVDGISLFEENLQWLSSLSSIQYLQLDYANLSFDWLHVLQSLPSLTELHLTSCVHHHHFHLAIMTNFTSLAILDISYSYDFGASSIPNWIFQLKNLVSLQLGGNHLQGSIPNDIKNLTLIEELDLSDNLFNSTIPDWLYSLNHLKSLSLSGNNLHGEISKAIENLTSMVTLALSSNQLEGSIPSSLGNLCNIRSISLSQQNCNQQVSEILRIFSGCASHTLERLSISSSKLHGHLTNQIGIFKNLVYLDLSDNSIQGEIPISLRNLTSLNYLSLSGNDFIWNPFDVIQSLSALQALDISDNLFQGEVTEDHLANFTELYSFAASKNKLILKVGSSWKPSFRKLKMLYMASWHLGPHFPAWIQSLNFLILLDISHNNISDSLPSWTLDNVVVLDLSDNCFSGSIASFLCQRKVLQMRLSSLNLASNNLSGEIPDCWMMWPNLMSVKFDSNHFNGNLPLSLGSLPWLGSLRLRNNALSGNFPICLKNSTRLVFVDLSENQLIGNIPLWVGHVLNLKVFLLRTNKFIGEIPSQICSLNSLQILDLGQNQLTGQIPKCINNLTAILVKNNTLKSYIWSEGNRTSDSITDVFLALKGRDEEYDFPGLITSIDLSDNKLTGEIPSQITSLMGLHFLNLSNNHFHGEIPQSIGNMGSLQSMDFSNNKLCGKIPSSISNLNFLNKLNLSYNNLTGKIPAGTQLQSFEASSFIGNDLCGPPLPNECADQYNSPNHGHNDKETHGNEINWFYVSMSLGFVSGFWVVVGPLLYNRSWRYTYFRFLDCMWYKLQSGWC